MAQYFVVKKDGKEITSQGIAGAFESYDSFGRSDVIIEKHIIDIDAKGILKEYIYVADRMFRKTCKSGLIRYGFGDLKEVAVKDYTSMKGLKKTEYQIMVSFSIQNPKFRRVWTDGTWFYIKDEGKIWNITSQEHRFQRI